MINNSKQKLFFICQHCVTGSQGVYLEFRSNDRRMMDFLKTLNFFQVLRVEGPPANLVVMGTKL